MWSSLPICVAKWLRGSPSSLKCLNSFRSLHPVVGTWWLLFGSVVHKVCECPHASWALCLPLLTAVPGCLCSRSSECQPVTCSPHELGPRLLPSQGSPTSPFPAGPSASPSVPPLELGNPGEFQSFSPGLGEGSQVETGVGRGHPRQRNLVVSPPGSPSLMFVWVLGCLASLQFITWADVHVNTHTHTPFSG